MIALLLGLALMSFGMVYGLGNYRSENVAVGFIFVGFMLVGGAIWIEAS